MGLIKASSIVSHLNRLIIHISFSGLQNVNRWSLGVFLFHENIYGFYLGLH